MASFWPKSSVESFSFENIGQNALPQRDVFHRLDIPPERRLGIGAAVDIIEEHARQSPACALAPI